MKLIERLGLSVLHRLDPEKAHTLSLQALQSGVVPLPGALSTPRLTTHIAGLVLPNPVGLAAGYDKNAQAIAPLSKAGFGFLELGAATPRPQAGNPKPRLFRLREDTAVINRFGFNNDGMDAIANRLARHQTGMIRGLNLGANKDSEDRAGDYAKVLAATAAHIDFATVNVSSPNTEKLRDLQGAVALRAVLERVMEVRAELPESLPIFLKIAPDLTWDDLAEIVMVAESMKIDAIIATNTTIDREGLKSEHKGEIGGLSGTPLFEKSTKVLAQLYKLTKLPLIGVGGIASPEDAFTKIKAGASAVQLYSGLVYQGISLVPDIVNGLDRLMYSEDYNTIAQAVGQEARKWT